jgi:hypothetical protein
MPRGIVAPPLLKSRRSLATTSPAHAAQSPGLRALGPPRRWPALAAAPNISACAASRTKSCSSHPCPDSDREAAVQGSAGSASPLSTNSASESQWPIRPSSSHSNLSKTACDCKVLRCEMVAGHPSRHRPREYNPAASGEFRALAAINSHGGRWLASIPLDSSTNLSNESGVLPARLTPRPTTRLVLRKRLGRFFPKSGRTGGFLRR